MSNDDFVFPCKLTIMDGNRFGELFLNNNSDISSVSASVANGGNCPAGFWAFSFLESIEITLDDDCVRLNGGGLAGRLAGAVAVVVVECETVVCGRAVVLVAQTLTFGVKVEEAEGRLRLGGGSDGNSSVWPFFGACVVILVVDVIKTLGGNGEIVEGFLVCSFGRAVALSDGVCAPFRNVC